MVTEALELWDIPDDNRRLNGLFEALRVRVSLTTVDAPAGKDGGGVVRCLGHMIVH